MNQIIAIPLIVNNKRDGISTNRCLMKKCGLLDSVGTDFMSTVYAFNQYADVEYNKEDRNIISNGKFSSSNKSLVSTLTSHYFTSTNDKSC